MKKPLLIILFIVSLTLASYAQGQWEIGIHYATWGTSYFGVDTEDNIPDAFESYSGSLKFDPHGHNYGIGIRFFPGGKHGSFSLGSLTTVTISMQISAVPILKMEIRLLERGH